MQLKEKNNLADNWSVSIIKNQDADFEYPSQQWPYIVFLRCRLNPVASGWCFAKSYEDARTIEKSYLDQLTAHQR